MKKIVSLLLALIIAFSCLTVAFAADAAYTCPYSGYDFIKGADGSYSYELVECGKSFSTLAAYDAHVLTCRYHTGSSLGVTLSSVTDFFLRLYTAETKLLGYVVPVVLKVIEFVQKLASGESLF